MARSVLITDDFNRADEALGPTAAYDVYTGASDLEVNINEVRAAVTNARCWVAHTTIPNNDQYVQAKIGTAFATGDFFFISVRGDAPATAQNAYILLVRPAAGNTQLYRVDAAALVSLAFVADPGWVVGDVASLEIVGTALTAKRNGSTFGLSATDGTYTSGRCGLAINVPVGGQSNIKVDDFEFGNIVADASGQPKARLGIGIRLG